MSETSEANTLPNHLTSGKLIGSGIYTHVFFILQANINTPCYMLYRKKREPTYYKQ